jgi:hypothetical protein
MKRKHEQVLIETFRPEQIKKVEHFSGGLTQGQSNARRQPACRARLCLSPGQPRRCRPAVVINSPVYHLQHPI